MSQSKTFSVSKDLTVRKPAAGGTGKGSGKSKHLYVGRYGSYDYDSFIEFSLDWTDVGKIVSATLNLYTDEYNSLGPAGEVGIMAAPASSDLPTVVVYRLTEEFTEGTSADGTFDADDYQSPTKTTTGGKSKEMLPKGADLLNTIDITAIVRAWAPATVEGGGRAANHGIMLYGKPEASKNWSGWSREHTGGGGASERPSITLVYELGATTPDAPSNMTPSGSVGSLTTFEGDFTDVRPTDQLQSTSIEIYDAGAGAVASASANTITKNSGTHGLHAGDEIYFSSVGTSGLTALSRYYVLSSGLTTTAFKVSTTAGGSVKDITDDSAVTYTRKVGSLGKVASESDRAAAHFIVPYVVTVPIFATRTYRWRARVMDNEGKLSAWSSLVSFVLTNTAPDAPTLSPVAASSYSTLALLSFKGGTFHDDDAGDVLGAHQVQLSPFPNGDIRWDEADGILWDTGKTFDPYGVTSWEEKYAGAALTAGTYYWRARQWDQRGGVSDWSTAISIVLTQDFDPDPGSLTVAQANPQTPWRIMIRNLYQSDGVTKTAGRGPGQLVAVLEESKNVGASIVYNSPGELHFTLLKDDPQIAVIEPKQVHYAVEFYQGDGWQEKFAGVIWDLDATELDYVFKGIDYLSLYDTVIDERYDPLKPNRSYNSSPSGSFYEDVTIRTVVMDQLNRAKGLANSWVGFISIGSVATMNEKISVYSTMQPTLSFIGGLIDSHRQGTGKRTRMKVVKTSAGGYQVQIVDDPGVIREDLAMYYGELVQGYRIIVFGDGWANVQHIVGRNRDGVKVVYKTIQNQPFQPSQSVYGRIATVAVMDGVQDQADLNRRALQAAIQAAKLGRNIAIGIRTEYLAPLTGWDICDVFPLQIKDGTQRWTTDDPPLYVTDPVIDTDNFGSGYWAAYAAAWEATDIGQQSLVITFLPREDSSAPDPDLLPSTGIDSSQPEWQLGWTPPPLTATSRFWLDQTTGKVYERVDEAGTLVPVTGTA